MKILLVSDQIDPFVYSSTIKEVFADIDCVLCAGDLSMDYVDFIVSSLNKPTYFVFGNHNLEHLKYFHKELQKEDQHLKEYSCGAIYAGFSVIRDNSLIIPHPVSKKPTPLLIAGVSGSRDYNHGQCQYTENQMKFKLLKLVPQLIMNKIRYGRYLDIFLTHATPRHVHDHEDNCHKGFKVFNRFLKKYKPTFMVHGHIHLYDLNEPRISRYDHSIIVNAYGHYVIELPVTDSSDIPVIVD